MPVDLLARASAAAALARTSTVDLFVNFAAVSVDAGVSTVVSSGYSTAGIGAGTYVADALATAALGASYPALCKRSANGRWFRLAGSEVTVEQAGAVGVVGTNDQPAIQQAVSYAAAVGIPLVRFTRTAYELWCPQRTGNFFVLTTDGRPIVLSRDVELRGLFGGTTLRFRNSLGGSKDTISQTASDGQSWQGGGIFCAGGGAITRVTVRNLILDGGVTYNPGGTNPPPNLSDKGFAASTESVSEVYLHDCEMRNWQAEIFYLGGNKPNLVFAENVKLHHSPQSAWNPGTLAKLVAINLEAYDTYQPAEIIMGAGHTYIGGRFANGTTFSMIGTQFTGGGYPFTYPQRDTATVPVWCTFIGTRFEKITNLLLGSWSRGSIQTVDTALQIGPEIRDIALEIEAWCDQNTGGNVVTFFGPANLTTQVSGAPAGTLSQPPQNIRVTAKVRRTQLAKANGRTIDGVAFIGTLVDRDSVQVHIEGEVRNVVSFLGAAVAGFGLPLVTTANLRPLAQAFGGTFDAPAADKAYDCSNTAFVLQPTVAGPINLTMASNLSPADEQRLVFYHNGVAGRQLRFAASGTGLSLPADRVLGNPGDRIELRYDARTGKWTEDRFYSTFAPLPEATTAEMLAGTSSARVVTPRKLFDAAAPVTLADGATIAPDFAAGLNFTVTLGGNRTLAAPLNARAGQSGTIRVVQDATGGRTLSYGSGWRFPGGAGSGGALSTGAGAVDILAFVVGSDGLVYAALTRAYA